METWKLAENTEKELLCVGKKFGEPQNGAGTVRRFRSPYQQNEEYPDRGVVFFTISENNLSFSFKMGFRCSEDFKKRLEVVHEPKTTPGWLGEGQNATIHDITFWEFEFSEFLFLKSSDAKWARIRGYTQNSNLGWFTHLRTGVLPSSDPVKFLGKNPRFELKLGASGLGVSVDLATG